MKDTKKQTRMFSFFDYDGMARNFEKMAEEGWLLTKVNNRYFHYKKRQPQKVKFAVIYYADRSDFDPVITEGQMNLNEFCRHAGWQFVDSLRQIHVYCNFNENPLPLETDPVVQVENVHRAMKKNFLPSCLLLMVLSLLIVFTATAGFFTNPLRAFTDLSQTFIIVIYILLVAIAGREVVVYYLWRKKAKILAEKGFSIPSGRSNIKFQIISLVIVLGVVFAYFPLRFNRIKPMAFVIIYAGIGGVTVLAVVTKELLKKLKAPRNLNRTITFVLPFIYYFVFIWALTSATIRGDIEIMTEKYKPVESYDYMGRTQYVYHRPIPLKVEDLLPRDEINYNEYSYEIESEEGLLASKHRITQLAKWGHTGVPEITYEIVKAKPEWVYNILFEYIFDDIDTPYKADIPDELQPKLMPQDEKLWKAKKVWRLTLDGRQTGQYLICFEDKIIDLQLHFKTDNLDTQLIGEKLAAF